MHELSVAQRLVELVGETLDAATPGPGTAHGTAPRPSRVRSVRLRLGPLSGVAAQALRFAYDEAAAGTALEGSVLEIEEVRAAVFCPACDAERELEGVRRLCCPVCGSATPNVVRGRELEVESVEVEEFTK